MNRQRFLIQLGVFSIFVALINTALHQIPQVAPHQLLTWSGWFFFTFFSLLMYIIGERAANSKNKHHFTNVALGFTGGKMFLTLIIIAGYSELAEPESRFFVLPFMITYLCFTIFETYFMMKLGKTKS